MSRRYTQIDAKRRRLTQSSSILARPFKPPSRVGVKSTPGGTSLGLPATATVDSQEPSLEAAASSAGNVDGSARTSSRDDGGVGSNQSLGGDLPSPVSSSPAATSTVPSVQSDQIKAVREEIDTLRRAHDLLEADQLNRLTRLIDKWRKVAQSAADELYPSVKARAETLHCHGLCDRDQITMQAASMHEDNPEYYSDRSDVDYCRSPGTVRDFDYPATNTAASSDHAESRLFDMETMLRTLNIDMDLVGYDAELEQWRPS